MTVTMTSREFNQETGRAKKAAEHEPVFITDRGEQTHVLLSVDAYRRLAGAEKSMTDPRMSKTIGELLSMPFDDDTDFEPARMSDDWGLKIPDLS